MKPINLNISEKKTGDSPLTKDLRNERVFLYFQKKCQKLANLKPNKFMELPQIYLVLHYTRAGFSQQRRKRQDYASKML